MKNVEVEVIKLGGSLLSRPNIAADLRAWVAQEDATLDARCRVLVMGGGQMVDALRAIAASGPLTEYDTHWRAIDIMHVTGRILATWLGHVALVEQYESAVSKCRNPGWMVLLPRDFLRNQEQLLPGKRLEEGWHVTSDSIAGRLATCLGATKLRLVKSRQATSAEAADWTVAAQNGLVDSYFPQLVDDFAASGCQVATTVLPQASEVEAAH